jgi:hypothetical protein
MKGVIIHGLLLALMLGYGYKNWTTERTATSTAAGEVVLWDHAEGDIEKIVYEAPKKTVRLERRRKNNESYWWGTQTRVETKAKPMPAPSVPAPGTRPPVPGVPPGHGAPPGHGHGPPGASPTARPPTAPAAAVKIPLPPGGVKPAAPGPAKSADPRLVAQAGSPAAPGSAAPAAASAPPPAKAAHTAPPAVVKAAAPTPTVTAPPSAAPVSPATPAASAAATVAADEPAPETVSVTTEFPVNPDEVSELLKTFSQARAIRDLGVVKEELKKDYKLDDTQTAITIHFKGGSSRSLVIGGQVTGGRYVMDPISQRGYVVATKMVTKLESGETSLRLSDPRGFDPAEIQVAVIAAGNKERAASRASNKDEKGATTKTWNDSTTGKPDTQLANFIDNLDRLRPRKFDPSLNVAAMTKVVAITYKDSKAAVLGTMILYSYEKPPATPAGDNPVKPPGPVVEYYIMTEKTRVPALVDSLSGDRIKGDIASVFGA